MKEPRERGRQTTAILTSPAAFRRPRAVVLPCRECNIGCNGPSVPSWLLSEPDYASFRTSGGCAARSPEPRRCRRASVRAVASSARPRSPAPESEASFTSRRPRERKARPPQPGTDPAPLQTLSCCVPRVGQGCGEYGGGSGGGDKFAASANGTRGGMVSAALTPSTRWRAYPSLSPDALRPSEARRLWVDEAEIDVGFT